MSFVNVLQMDELVVSDTAIYDDGAVLLSQCVDKFQKLTLWNCGLTNRGITSLARQIEHLTNPVLYVIYCNNIV